MDAEALFLRTLDDLQQRAVATDEYEALLAAALLRKLLLDSHPLVDQVNVARRLKLRFRINGPTAYEEMILRDGAGFFSLEDAIDPDLEHPPGFVAPFDATRDQLLARRLMVVKGEDVTVRDLIDQLSHIEGAVHRSDPQKPREMVLSEAARELYIGDLTGRYTAAPGRRASRPSRLTASPRCGATSVMPTSRLGQRSGMTPERGGRTPTGSSARSARSCAS